jgi:hypothetical protein
MPSEIQAIVVAIFGPWSLVAAGLMAGAYVVLALLEFVHKVSSRII